jgi:hypothetical protein
MDAENRQTINEALCDQKTTAQLSSSGDAAKRTRKDNKRRREELARQAKAETSVKDKIEDGSSKEGAS